MDTFKQWEVPRDYVDPMYNYLVYAYSPGSFFTSVLANDFVMAMQSSHPGNTIPALKNLVGWMSYFLPKESWKTYDNVEAWLTSDETYRRDVLVKYDLVYTKEQEMMLALQGKVTVEPVFW